jgi:DNA replication protein DnaC
MTNLHELWKQFKLLTDMQNLAPEERKFMETFLAGEAMLKEQKRQEYLLRMSGIKRIKLLADFDWAFNPKLPREKFMEFINTWHTRPCNLVIIGPSGTGKTHAASALCYDAVVTGKQTVFLTLFDLTAKLSKARSVYSLIDYYAKIPVLCIDEIGYVMPSREHADHLFQIISKRSETGTTIVTTNLIPSLWGKIFDSTTASAILDRLSLHGTFITFEGRSYRNKKNERV